MTTESEVLRYEYGKYNGKAVAIMMTRFQKEISGTLGEFWMNSAKREVEMSARKATEDAVVDEDGAISWKSNGKYLMDDFCEKLEYAGFSFSREKTAEKRNAQNDEFLTVYKKFKTEPSREELDEMRTVFGSGAKVVDLITGKTIQL